MKKSEGAKRYQTSRTERWILTFRNMFALITREAGAKVYRSFSYSALASFKIGTSGSASFHNAKKS